MYPFPKNRETSGEINKQMQIENIVGKGGNAGILKTLWEKQKMVVTAFSPFPMNFQSLPTQISIFQLHVHLFFVCCCFHLDLFLANI